MDPRLTASEFLEALCLFREARGQGNAEKAAILAVIRNRAADEKKRWPRTTSGVILQPMQFSSFSPNDPNVSVFPQTSSPGAWQAWIDCCNVVTVPLTADPTDGANHYHSIPDAGYTYKNAKGENVKLMPPSWADPAKMTLQIGTTKFYKL
jgi:hypothetical protein